MADLLEGLLTVLLFAGLEVLGSALEGLGLVVDDAHAILAIQVADVGASILKLLFEGLDLLVLSLELRFLRLILLAEVGDIALKFIGRGDSTLKLDDGNFGSASNGDGGAGGRIGGSGSGGLSNGCDAHSGREHANE